MVDLRLEGFFPALNVPIESAPSAILAFLYLLLAIFTLTSQPSLLVISIRFALSAASSYQFLRFGYCYETSLRSVESGMAIIAVYGLFRNVETAFAYLMEPIPRWVQRGEVKKIPDTFLWRAIWSLDLLFSMRGTSYLPNTHWNFVPAALIAPKHDKNRLAFLIDQVTSLLGQFLLIDIFDSIIKAWTWQAMPDEYYPITSLHPFEQAYYAIAVCMMTALSISITYTAISVVAVMFGSCPASWPPLFDDPFHATSLQSFWTHKWHASFRRIFLMASAAIVNASHFFISHSRTKSAVRGLWIFLCSCLMHLGLMYRIRPPGLSPEQAPFFEGETLLFFLLQPVGMLLEVTTIKPLAEYRFGRGRDAARNCTRLWTWIWLLWTGRYWSDVWVRHGMWAPGERVVGYSLVRGLLYGNWEQ